MRVTKGQLKRIIREEYTRLKRQGLIRESEESYEGLVTIWIDCNDYPEFDIDEFREMSEERAYGKLDIFSDVGVDEQYRITGPFDQLWTGWVNTIGDDPEEFMERVVAGHENCPDLDGDY